MGFSIDQDQHNRAIGTGALEGGLSGAVGGATIGSAAGPVGTVVGGIVGAAVGAVAGGGAAGLQDTQTQQDAYKARMATLSAKQSADYDSAAIARDQSGSKAPNVALQYMGSGPSATGLSGGTSYDRWKAGGV